MLRSLEPLARFCGAREALRYPQQEAREPPLSRNHEKTGEMTRSSANQREFRSLLRDLPRKRAHLVHFLGLDFRRNPRKIELKQEDPKSTGMGVIESADSRRRIAARSFHGLDPAARTRRHRPIGSAGPEWAPSLRNRRCGAASRPALLSAGCQAGATKAFLNP